METKPAIVGSSFLHNGTLYEITGVLTDGIVVRDTSTHKQYSLIPNNYIERDLTTIFIAKNGIKQNNLQFYWINNKTLKAYLKEFVGAENE